MVECTIRIIDVQLTNLQKLSDANISEECSQHKLVLQGVGPTFYQQGGPKKVPKKVPDKVVGG